MSIPVVTIEAAIDLHRSGRMGDAEQAYRSLLAKDEKNPVALHYLGLLHHQNGDSAAATTLIGRAIELRPDYAAAIVNLGMVLTAAGRLDEAVSTLERACALAPDLVDGHLNLGNALYRLERFEGALACFSRALAIDPNHVSALTNYGSALRSLGRYTEAEAALRKATELTPADAVAAVGLANVIRDQDRPAEAEKLYRSVLARDGKDAEALCNLGIALRDQGRIEEALRSFETLRRVAPDYANGHLNLAMTLLLDGQIERGWSEYEGRFKVRRMRPDGLDGPAWDGKPFAGTLLIHAEQGMGDTVQFARFIAAARDRVSRVVLMCHTGLKGPLSRVAGVDEVIGFDDQPPRQDRIISLLSLPHVLGIGAGGLSAAPYLSALPHRVAAWRNRLAELRGTKVGIVWAGSPAHPLNRRRSLGGALMNLLPRVPGIAYVSLQQGPGAADIAVIHPPILDLGAEITDVEDSLAIVSQLDLVVTADTAMAHLAGALGRPVLLLLPFAPDWRWQLGRGDSPWYPSLSLFRQSEAGAWMEPLIRAGAELVARTATVAAPATVAALLQQALAHHRDKRHAEAELCIWRALAVGPQSAQLLLTLGALRVASGQNGSAVALLSHGMLLGGPDAEALANLGVALRGEERLHEAEQAYRRAIEIAPGLASAYYNLANLLSARGEWAEAENLYQRALAGNPHNIDAVYNLANAVRDQGRLGEAIALYRRALELRPNYHAVRDSLGMCLLLDGQFTEGWDAYEARWLGDMVPRGFTQPVWDGSNQARKTLLIHAEQGMGDTIQFLRYVPLAAERFGGKIVLEVQAPLVELIGRALPGIAMVAQNDPLPKFDTSLPLLSLPHLFGTTAETVPDGTPYLTALPELAKRWRREMGKGHALRVGLVWAGNPRHKNDRNRSLPYGALAGLPQGDGIRYFALQTGDRCADIDQAILPVEDLGARIESFDDTAAIIAGLDLLIACDTAAAHLAGALAVPVWMPLPVAPDWRWLLARDDTPWYPAMRLFRQPHHGDWTGPIGAMAEILEPIAKGESLAALFGRAKDEHGKGRHAMARATAEAVLALAPSRKDAAKFAAWHGESADPLAAELAVAQADLELGHPNLAERTCLRALRSHPDREDAKKILAAIRRSRVGATAPPPTRSPATEVDPVIARERRAEQLYADSRHAEAKEELRLILARTDNIAALERFVELCGANQGEGVPALERLITLRPNDAKLWHRYGTALYFAERIDDAEAAMRRALEFAPAMIEAQSDLGAILTRKGDTETAIAALKRAMEINPRYAATYGNLGVAMRKAGRAEEAVAALDQALVLQPDYHDYHWNRALALLHAGRYAEGWREFEWRWKVPGFPSPVRGFKEPLWGGEPLDGRTILIYAEQGLGDAFEFLRYVPLVAARGGVVILEVPPSLVELCKCLPGVSQIVPAGQPLPRFDVQAPLLSLPLAFGTTLETIPAQVPYLTADPVRVAQWRGQRDRRFTVGLIWAGRKKPDPTRTIGLAALKPLLDIPDIRFVGLQKELEPGEDTVLAELEARFENWGGRFESFADTAAAMTAVDHIISIDTSSAHLAGALGRPTWVMLPRAVDWRWMTGRDDNPWYPTMRLFRRGPKEEWAPVVARVADALRARAAETESQKNDPQGDARAFQQAVQFIAQGQYDAADAALRELLVRAPDHAEALHHLGIIALKRNRPADAKALIAQAVKIDDTLDAAWANLGVAQRESGDTASAVESYRRALALNPKSNGALYNLGNIHAARGEDAEAIDCFRRTLALAPTHANALNNLGLALQRRGALDEATEMLARAADADSRGTDAAANLALALFAKKDLPRALAASARAVADRPNSALAHRVHALVLKADGQLDAAINHLSRALQIDPKSAEAYNLLGNTLKGLGRVRDAVAAFDKALALDPARADARFNRATVLLLTGDFKDGWTDYELRWQAQGFARRTFPQPEWDGKPLAGRTILVHAEQGLGDTIQFARYLPKLAEAGGKVVAEVQADLVDLVRTIDGVADVVAVGRPLPEFAVHAPMLSLPRLLGTTVSTIPAETPYLRAPAGSGAGLPDLAHAPGLKVGLVWAGNPGHSGDRWRSLDLAALKPILDTPGVTFVSLQKGDAAVALADAEAAIIDAAPALKTFADTAALIDQLDLVIAVDTATAHCAGALGRPVWVMLPTAPDWRWLLNTPRSPWYPSMRLYRQEKLDDWSPVVARIAADLTREVALKRDSAAAAGGRPSQIEVASGAEIAKNRKPVIFKWGMSSYFGWGVYGVNLVLSWAEDKDVVPVCSVPFNPDNIVLDALRRRRIEPELKASRRLIDGLAAHRGGKINSSSLVLHGLGNRMGAVASAHDVELNGARNIGVLFIEDTTVDDQVRERAKRYELLIAGSTWNKTVLEAGGIATAVQVVLQGVDHTLFHPAPRSGLFKDRFVVFSGGKLEYRKGQDLALLAFRTFAERHPEALLVTAWHSPWPDLARALTVNNRIAPVPFSGGKADLTGWAMANGIPADKFLDLGQVPNAQMPTILRECDVALFTNRGEGGTNLVAMECMAAGVPCILSANTGHLDLIRDDTCLPLSKQGKVAPIGSFQTDGWGESDVDEAVEALELLWLDRQRAGAIGLGGAALLAQMSWPNQMMRLKEIILPYVR